MECPNCKEEPIKLFSLGSTDISLWNKLRGYMKCVNCGTFLKRKYGKPFWYISALTVVSYLCLFLIFELAESGVVDPFIFPAWFFMALFVYILVLLAAMAYSAVFFLKFERTEIDN